MATSVTIKASTDALNDLGFGTDNGLFCVGTGPRGGPYQYTLDNSIAVAESARTFWYQLPTYALSYVTPVANTAQIFPIMFSRPCRVTDLILLVSTAGAGSSYCVSMYANNTTTGAPGAKLVDLARFDTSVTSIRNATILAPNYTFGPGQLYWGATWCYTTSAYPSVSARAGTTTAYPSNRMSAVPTYANYWTNNVCQSYSDTSANWSSLLSAPATISPSAISPASAPTGLVQTYPHFSWGLFNI